ncbi:MAG: toxin-antitoxin system YwqK family antitoxin [Cryomorphaceae bacterium]|nr:hypothetical protein [Flavobacteriales bacterium]
MFGQGEYTVYYYDNGNVSSEGYMENGNPNGYWKTYYPNGELKSDGNRKNFLLDSTWNFYNESGLKTSEINYKKGNKHGSVITYQNGVKYEVSQFENDVKVGTSKIYFPTGELKKTIPYENGKENGKGFEYERDGRIITLLEYEDGFLRKADRVNRFDDRNKKRGTWIDFHPNGQLALEGYYMNGKKNGIFKKFDRDGNLISLEKYRDGELVVDSEESVILDLRSTYYPNGKVKSTGGYVDGVKEGVHRLYDEDGSISTAITYEKGQKTGEGIVDKKGDLEGEWKLYYPTGELMAEGTFKNSSREGDWIFYFRNGNVESRGKYSEGLPQGEWRWYYPDKSLRRVEYFRRGKEDGESVEYDKDGNVISEGEYISGLREGEWTYKVGDHFEKGNYLDGERHGEWIYEYEDGELNFEGEYVSGLPVGKHEWYYKSGQVKKEGKYSSGVRTGTWKTYDKEGYKILDVKYKNGREVRINGRKVERAEDIDIDEL